MRFPRTLCERKLGEAISHLRHQRVQDALLAISSAQDAFECMNRDIGDDVPPEPNEREDFAGHIERCRGQAYLMLNQLAASELALRTAVTHFERTGNPAVPATLRLLGVVLRRLDRAGEALDCYERAISVCALQGDEEERHLIEHNAGNLCSDLHRNDEALAWYGKAKNGYQRLKLVEKEADVQKGIGATRLQMGDYERAAQAYQAARDLLSSEADSVGEIAGIDLSLGSIEAHQGKLADAIPHFDRARCAVQGRPEYADCYLKSLQCLANAYLQSSRPAEAMRCLHELHEGP